MMTADQFKAWQSAMGISGAEASRRLGVTANTVTKYRRKGGDRLLMLACLALFHRLQETPF